MAPRSHVVRAGQVTLWKDICVRATGFPARMVLGTAAEHSVPMIDAALDDERRSRGSWTDARPAIEAAFQQDQLRTSSFLREVARMPRFHEALLWQNRGAVHGGIAALLRRPVDAIDAKTRKLERAVASYLQRYCVKNDTIGFFGPVGWGMLDDQVVEHRIVPGPTLLDRRTVYFGRLEVPTAGFGHEHALRAALAGSGSQGQVAEAALAELEAARDRVAGATTRRISCSRLRGPRRSPAATIWSCSARCTRVSTPSPPRRSPINTSIPARLHQAQAGPRRRRSRRDRDAADLRSALAARCRRGQLLRRAQVSSWSTTKPGPRRDPIRAVRPRVVRPRHHLI